MRRKSGTPPFSWAERGWALEYTGSSQFPQPLPSFLSLSTEISPKTSHHEVCYVQTTMATTSESEPANPFGVKVWHDPGSANLDVCFVHGLNGSREKTWTAHRKSTPWPVELLPAKFPNARLFAYGYDAAVVPPGAASTATVTHIADDLVRSLANNREE